MGLQLKSGKEPGRNDPCPCGSKLKFKHCHGDLTKKAVCNAIVREKMLELIKAEQKKQGIIPYDYTCNSCGHGFDKPKTSTIGNCDICPKCDSTDIKTNINVEEEN